MDISEPLSLENIPSKQRENVGYCKEFWQSFHWIYLKHKWFDEQCKYLLLFSMITILKDVYLDWKSAFCSSSFEIINKYPNITLIYRTFLFAGMIFHLIHGLVTIRPIYEWPIYYTHLTLLVTFFAILFQFIITYRVNFYRGNDIVPRHSLQYIHMILILISLGSGLAVSLLYWALIHQTSVRFYSPKIILDHGIFWFLLLTDVFFFTRLPFYMIDCIPSLIFAMLYGIFTLLVYFFQWNFSRNRVGYVYLVFNFNQSPVRVTMQLILFIFVVPCAITWILWHVFRLRRSIHVKMNEEKEESSSNVLA